MYDMIMQYIYNNYYYDRILRHIGYNMIKGGIFMDEKEFGARLSKLRTNKGVSARDMSLTMGQNHGYISYIENGKSYPSMSGFFFICEYLGITPLDFFDIKSKNPKILTDLIDNLKKLDDTQLENISSIVNSLVNAKK